MSLIKTLEVFGQNYQSSVAGSNTNATAVMKTATSITTPGLTVGVYRIGWYINYSMSIITADFQSELKVGASQVMITRVELSDATTVQTASGFYYLTESTGGTVYTINLNFAAESGTATVNVSGLEFWRAS